MKNFSLKNLNMKKIVLYFTPLMLLLGIDTLFIMPNITTLISILIIYSLYFLLGALFNNNKYASVLLSALSFIIVIICKFKYEFTREPFFISDLLYSSDMSEILSLVKSQFLSKTIKLFPLIIYYFMLFSGIALMNIKHNNYKFKLPRRIITIFTSIIILLILFIPNKKVDTFIMNNFYKVNTRKAITSNRNYCWKYGYFSSMYGNILESRIFKPDNYNKVEIDKIVKTTEYENDKTLGKPNIIVIFSESFMDIDLLDEIEFDKPITKNFNELKKEGIFFNMISPSFGGTSANVEFEFLTGSSLNYFSSSAVPYMNLYNTPNYSNTPSILNDLSDNGYYVKLVPFSSNLLFDCGKVYKLMKIDEVEFIPKVDKKYKKGTYVSEEYVADKIIDNIKNKPKDKPLFYMTMTMETHMPYSAKKYKKYDIDIVNSKFSKSLNGKIKSYAQGVYDADKQLGRLYEYIKTLDEPTIIVFYGDHLPHIMDDKFIKYFNTENKLQNLYRKYNTQSLILANFDIDKLKEENKELKYLGPDLLGAYLLNHMDINVSDYFKWVYSTRNIIGASNRYVSIDQNGQLFYTDELKGEKEELYELRKRVQYRYLIK